MNILQILVNGIKKASLLNEFLLIVFISLVAAVLEILGLAAFSLLMINVFSDGNELNNNILSILLNKLHFSQSNLFVTYLFISVFILNIITSFFTGLAIHRIISYKYHHFRSFVFYEYIKKDFKDITKNSIDDIINRVNVDPGKFLTRGFGSLCIIFKNLIILSSIFLYLLTINIYILYIILFFLFFFGVYSLPFVNKYFKNISVLERGYNIEALLSPNNIINNYKEIKLFFAESFFSKKFYDSSNKFYKTQMKLFILRGLPKIIIELSLIILIAFIFIIFSEKNSNETTFIVFSTLVFALIRTIPYIVQIARCYTEILGAQEYILSFFKQDYPTRNLDKKTVEKIIFEKSLNEKIDNNIINQIELRNIIFRFKEKLIFENLNLVINKNDKILIYGDSGEGKSVLLEILSGFRSDFKGKILINNKEQNVSSITNLKKNIGLVSQNVSLLDSSLLENIAFGVEKEDISETKVISSLQSAGLSEFCNETKLSQFKINSSFKNISEGQAKRLALARCFYFDKNIILLDETTANLDKKLEREILIDLLDKKDLTLLLVSHDPELRNYFEKIYKVENKTITQQQ